ncbi:NitT/TauT family transport system permease protein [Tamaricihabitans halophyticus]|uniref:NitT/TauT family transport system permease protein n=1 Tax=Tamaricihabitans halophyticus TaxID=1262583 RepID=A0A4R2RB38_9PSEU|nr:ABC transporter permease [Tamaricihabitans halophyticus]TCP56635.1 NitT/TauT family transport system permease protein [Tamaricihabitans halophyticus]
MSIAATENPLTENEAKARRTAAETAEASKLAAARRKRGTAVWLTRIVLFGLVVGGWEFVSGNLIDPFWISSPSDTAARLGEWMGDGTLWLHSAATLQAMALGFLVGATGGVVLGFTLGRSKFASDVLNPLIIAMNSLPKLALAPLFILWFGVGLESKVGLTAVVVFFLVFHNSYSGARNVDQELLDVVALMGARGRDKLFKVIIPSAATWVFTGLRLAVPYSLIGAVISEITASNEGLGYLLKRSANTFDTAGTFVAIVVLMVVAVVINFAVSRAERYTSRWM